MSLAHRWTAWLALGALLGAPGLRADATATSAVAASPAAEALAAAPGAPEALAGDGLPDPDSLQQALALSPEQKDKLKVIRQAGREKRRQHQQKVLQLIRTLADQLQAKASDADLQATLDALKAERRAQQADQDALMDQAQAVLSPTQAAQYVLRLRDQMKAGLKRWKARQD
jgi:hypothetical protein